MPSSPFLYVDPLSAFSALQLTPMQQTGGKLETFIRRSAPAVLAALVDEGILKPS